jgi:hypothetical protein
LQLIQALAQLRLVETDPPLLAAYSMHRLKDISWQVPFASQFFKLGELTF